MKRSPWLVSALLAVAVVASIWYLVRESQEPPRVADPTTLVLAAGSELDELLCEDGEAAPAPDPDGHLGCAEGPSEFAKELTAATDVKLEPDFVGTLEAADEILADRSRFDAAWFASDHYLRLALADHDHAGITSSDPVMRSPVVLGVQASVADALGWSDGDAVSWSEIADAADSDDAASLSFLMTNPAASNSGLATLVGVASAFGTDGDPASADPAAMKKFFGGRADQAPSSGWLSDKFVDNAGVYGGLFNYESELLGLRRNGANLAIIYPEEGVVEATYPLTGLGPAAEPDKTAAYDVVAEYLLRTEIQEELSALTLRHPGTTDADRAPELEKELETAATVEKVLLPDALATLEGLLTAYFDDYSPKARTVFLLDVSGSMGSSPARLESLKTAFGGLTGTDTSISGQFMRFRTGEELTVFTYDSAVDEIADITVESPEDDQLDRLNENVQALGAGDGDTHYYDALDTAYNTLEDDEVVEGRQTSVVIVTDGYWNGGTRYDAFRTTYDRDYAALDVPTHVVLVADAAECAGVDNDKCTTVHELESFAFESGGSVVRSTNPADLQRLFKEIRAYQ
ncbi:vWA domain-containing protein [Promicromonospora iranensis]|uniref:vWA domain-containing protein n=1 Tax=Promicromonospora iranensis TaxID=1105144 RepID=UPI0023A9F302|nr:VWA domain-containing protein [Promicromonospora iranensis]